MSLPVVKWKKSDTLFILGSGPSINDYCDAHWSEIRRHDSVGWNFWLYHDFVPTYYFFEIPRYKGHCEAFYELLKIKARDYRDTPIIFNDISQADERCSASGSTVWHQGICFGQLPHFYAIHRIGIPGRSFSSMIRWMGIYARTGVFKERDKIWYLVKRRASLAMLIAFGAMAGYRKLVLCGIDYKSPAYFHDHPAYAHLPHGEMLRGKVNGTYDPSRNHETIEEIVLGLDSCVLKPKGIQMFVAHKECPLHGRIPLYPEFENLPARSLGMPILTSDRI